VGGGRESREGRYGRCGWGTQLELKRRQILEESAASVHPLGEKLQPTASGRGGRKGVEEAISSG